MTDELVYVIVVVDFCLASTRTNVNQEYITDENLALNLYLLTYVTSSNVQDSFLARSLHNLNEVSSLLLVEKRVRYFCSMNIKLNDYQFHC
jgi:hypothetical protein